MKKNLVLVIVLLGLLMVVGVGAVAAAQHLSPDSFLTTAGMWDIPWEENGNVSRHSFIASCSSPFGNDLVYLDNADEAFYQDWKISTLGVQGDPYQLRFYGLAPANGNDYYEGTFKIQVTWLDKDWNVIRKDKNDHIHFDESGACGNDTVALNGTVPNDPDLGAARIIVAKHNDSKAAVFYEGFLAIGN